MEDLRGDRLLGDLRGDRLVDLRGFRRLEDLLVDRRLVDLRGDRRLEDLRGDRLEDLWGDRRLEDSLDFLRLKPISITDLLTATLLHTLFKLVNIVAVSTNPVQLPGKVRILQASVFDHQNIDIFNKV